MNIACPAEVLAEIEEHAHSDLVREVGGILVGRFEGDEVSINAALPALSAVGQSAQVTFTHQVWDELLPRIDADYPDSRIVGWYHTHPSFGIFLSEHDRFIHANFFSDPMMVALVVDPIAGELGWFGWHDGNLELMQRGPARRAPEATPTRGRERSFGTVVLVALLLAVLGFGGGYLLGTSSGPKDSSALAAAHRDLAATRAQVTGLQTQLKRSSQTQQAPASSTPVTSTPSQFDFAYSIRRGDTMWRLADIFYGSGFEYPKIASRNPSVDPRGMEPGSILLVPLQPANTH